MNILVDNYVLCYRKGTIDTSTIFLFSNTETISIINCFINPERKNKFKVNNLNGKILDLSHTKTGYEKNINDF